jgi:mRNA-degrading endonuclease toxin of MazEF toxin-antitoxin module
MLRPPPRRGEIWLAYTPNQPDDPHQPRPVLIVSSDGRNWNTDDVIAVPIFRNRQLGPTRVAISAGVGGLVYDSVLTCEEIITLRHDFLERGPLGPPAPGPLLDRVVRAIRRAVGEVVPEIAPQE